MSYSHLLTGDWGHLTAKFPDAKVPDHAKAGLSKDDSLPAARLTLLCTTF